MKTRIFASILGVFLSGQAFSESHFSISINQQQHDCSNSNIQIRTRSNGDSVITADFSDSSMDAMVREGEDYMDTKTCEIAYDLYIDPGYKLVDFTFSLDGTYYLSANAAATAAAEHFIDNAYRIKDSIKVNGSGEVSYGDFSSDSQDPETDTILFVVPVDELSESAQACGGITSIETKLTTTVIMPPIDIGFSKIGLDEGVGRYNLARVRVIPCSD